MSESKAKQLRRLFRAYSKHIKVPVPMLEKAWRSFTDAEKEEQMRGMRLVTKACASQATSGPHDPSGESA